MRMTVLMLLVGWNAATSASLAALPIVCRSPSHQNAIELTLINRQPHYRVASIGHEVIGWSRLGLVLGDGEQLGRASEMVHQEYTIGRDHFEQFPGKRRTVVGEFHETTVTFRETPTGRLWIVVLRADNDGVAFRYRFPTQNKWTELIIAAEPTEFALPPEASIRALPLNSFTSSYEKRYQIKKPAEIPANWLLGLPMVWLRPDGGWAAVTEANINEYAGLYLAPMADRHRFGGRLSPAPTEAHVAVRAKLPHQSPWRVILLGDHIGRLVESDLILKLNERCAIADVTWIKPGKTTFPWWNGFVLEGVDFTPGLNTATAKHYIDFCAAQGIEYHSLDGMDDTAWYGGKIVPYDGADPTQAVSGIDLPELLRHARAKGIRLRLWMNWKAAEKHMDRAFPLYQQWGIEGVMLDFMDRDDQRMNRFVRRAVQLAAQHHLTVTLHGCPKPTGLERTYPNLLTHEGVLNLEYNKWDKLGCPPEHQIMVAFTRMLAGPLDFHQGSFRTVAPEKFQPRNRAPEVMGTPARTLASYVVYQNHLAMVADSPSAYAGHPAMPVLARIPTTWDDTRVLAAAADEFLVIMRRHGKTFHIGAMTDRQSRSIDCPLTLLPPGRFRAEQWFDAPALHCGLAKKEAVVSAPERLAIEMAPSGGAYIRLTPVE